VTVHVREREVRRRVPAVDRRADREAAAAEDLDADAGSGPVTAAGGGSVAADDLERTQPLTALREDDPEDPERP
jgi:hypothetical protein